MRNRRDLTPDFSMVRGRRLLIALSGGADSVALAALLSDARASYGLELSAVHVDHAIRPESAEDAEFCRDLCASLDIPFHLERVDVPALAKAHRRGLETEARIQRYQILHRLREETGAELIALAHHMDDQAEAVLMHLARGAGPQGICGMRALDQEAGLYRPLLPYRKAELVDYLRARGLTWREDATNTLDDNPRNALRLHAIPELEKCYPQFTRAVARFAASAQIESDFLAGLTRDYLRRSFFAPPGWCCRWLDLTVLPPRAVLRRALMEASGCDTLTHEQVNALEALCSKLRGRLDLSPDLMAERTGHRLYFARKNVEPIAPVPLNLNGATLCPPLCAIEAAPSPPIPVRNDPWRQVLNRDALRGAVVRTRLPGDRIRPLGCGEKLLSDYFTDRKIDRPLRDQVALVAVGSRVHWVTGFDISQEAAVIPGDIAVSLTYSDDIIRRKNHAK